MKLSDHAPDGAQTGTETNPSGSLQRMVRPVSPMTQSCVLAKHLWSTTENVTPDGDWLAHRCIHARGPVGLWLPIQLFLYRALDGIRKFLEKFSPPRLQCEVTGGLGIQVLEGQPGNSETQESCMSCDGVRPNDKAHPRREEKL